MSQWRWYHPVTWESGATKTPKHARCCWLRHWFLGFFPILMEVMFCPSQPVRGIIEEVHYLSLTMWHLSPIG